MQAAPPRRRAFVVLALAIAFIATVSVVGSLALWGGQAGSSSNSIVAGEDAVDLTAETESGCSGVAAAQGEAADTCRTLASDIEDTDARAHPGSPSPHATEDGVNPTTDPGANTPSAPDSPSTPDQDGPDEPGTDDPTEPVVVDPLTPTEPEPPEPRVTAPLAFTGISENTTVGLLGIRILSGYTLSLSGQPGTTATVWYNSVRAGNVVFDGGGYASIDLGGSLIDLGLGNPLIRATYADGTGEIQANRNAI